MNTDDPSDWFEEAKEHFDEELAKNYDEDKEEDADDN